MIDHLFTINTEFVIVQCQNAGVHLRLRLRFWQQLFKTKKVPNVIESTTGHDDCVAAMRQMCERLAMLNRLRKGLETEWWGDTGILLMYDEDIASVRLAIAQAVKIKPWLSYLVDSFIKEASF